MEIDIDLISAYNMSADEYILLMLIRLKHFGKIRSYFTDRSYLQTSLDRLVLEGFIELLPYGIAESPQDYKIVKLPSYSVAYLDSMFEEFLENYPKFVVRPNGMKEYLRSNTSKTRELYKKITQGSKEKHEFILACLQYQLSHFVRLGKMAYMRKMVNWLTNEEWEEYKDYVLDEVSKPEKEEEFYGSQIV